jgi:hypothetical protein
MADFPGTPPTAPPSPERTLEPVPQSLLDQALGQIRNLLRGNGVPPDAVAIKSFDGGVLDFEAYEIFHITPQVNEKNVNGKQQGKVITSEAELRREIQRTIEKAVTDPRVQMSVREQLRQRPDLGFGLDDQVLPLPSADVQYVVHSQCGTCHGSKASPCSHCNGRGRETCMRCKGRREITCPGCRGTGTQVQGNDQVQCRQCHGRRTIACTLCKQTGLMACTRCKGMGKMVCQNCGGTGWRTLIASIAFSAHGHFDYDRAGLPDQIPGQIDRIKATMVADKHADVKLVEDRIRLSDLEKIARPGDMIVPYRVRLPFGNIVFDVKGKEIPGKLFGQRPTLSKLPPFLEKTAGRGLRQLSEAAQSKGDIAKMLEQAVRTRLVADIVTAAASNSPAKAAKIVQRQYPHGIRAENIPPLVRYANICLGNLSRLPRLVGFGIGFVVCAALDAAYLFGPLRSDIVAGAGPAAALGADALLPIAGAGLASLAVLLACVHAIDKVMGKLKKDPKKKAGKLMPKPGQSIVTGAGAGLLAFIVVLHAAFVANHAPSWYAALMHVVGI